MTLSPILKKGLNLNAKFSAYKNKNYKGKIESVASRVDAQTRSILARAKINNENLEILPGSLLEIELLYLDKNKTEITVKIKTKPKKESKADDKAIMKAEKASRKRAKDKMKDAAIMKAEKAKRKKAKSDIPTGSVRIPFNQESADLLA